ncbi:Co-chaperone Hsc20 [Hypoxylon trugodes]|uniref:Co-chaperone Hsc20 n=1 Tax=Hypoxylon trugodes TaxID=326681 RepID=UPI0021934811|nr:Co-chaperone Hsc20 [Hypoxylon trugodes]KAI1383061.1 Co-chaperone Hsc20 [Hypoxylon trugodes]
MRSSIFPQRALRRVCDTCRHSLRNHAPSSHVAPLSTCAAPCRTSNPPHQSSGIRGTLCRTQSSNGSGSVTVQIRHISTNPRLASSAPGGAEAKDGDSGKVESKQARTHYDLFPQTLPAGPPPQGPFAVDVRALRREFLTLQATAHPDLAPPGSERRRAEAASAYINEAYRTLAEALPRAQYLLRLRGLDVANEETARVEDPELLMLVLETREAIEEAESEEELEPLREENEERIKESEGRLASAFEKDDIEEARLEVTRLRYWVNIRESIRNWERGKPIVLEH